ncbi:hypothetical protein GFD17_09020 [Bifidobacterium sp. SMB2]|uniref:FAD:protein FMN transferase n=1 Tax=Bifidobacterium saimiriisciurei TaxID=2661627 RepID=A0ABX0CFZ9_9BIFI|nr:hypothetical protein [Bifidobacterium sp. SMB2]NEH11583.1 hypothetical protein [Bifidobacterium saimiriisciurei]
MAVPDPVDRNRTVATLLPLAVTDHGGDSMAPASVSVATSGVGERRFESDGVVYHHILDPHTGRPARTGLTGATLVTRDSIDAEGHSTTVLALGSTRGARFVEHHPEILGALLVRDDGAMPRLGVAGSACCAHTLPCQSRGN